jgi:hypothetical protein
MYQYTPDYSQYYYGTVGDNGDNQFSLTWVWWGLGITTALVLGLAIFTKIIDPLRHRGNLMKQREKIIALAYYDVIKGEKSGEEAQKWLLEQFQSTSGVYEDELYDAEGIRMGKTILTKED